MRTAGCAIIGQTAELAPADRRLYAIRDVTATTDSIPLITASILSKKLAAGLDALVMDVKVGSGALCPSLETATALAESLLTVAARTASRRRATLRPVCMAQGHRRNRGRTSRLWGGRRGKAFGGRLGDVARNAWFSRRDDRSRRG